LSITLRRFLNILNEYKLIDATLLTTRDVVEIMASDNSLVFDSEDSYNLELEITFLEFFEILIGCAVKTTKTKQPAEVAVPKANRKSVTPTISDNNTIHTAPTPETTFDPNPNANANPLAQSTGGCFKNKYFLLIYIINIIYPNIR
jgi:hypothetical protein